MKISHAMLALAITAAAASGSVLAVTAADAKNTSTVSMENWLTIPAIYDKLVAAGYSDITEIEREHDGYEVKAIGPDGERVKIDVNPTTADVVKSRSDRDD